MLTPLLSRPRQGFALIVTIVLVAFLVLILVGLATFTRVETQVADNTESLSRARQNALAGLNIAVGQLQEHAGPDNRLTARSDITVTGAINHPHFTGVWRPTNNTNTPDVWLVNGPEAGSAVTPASLNPTNAATAAQVFLVDRRTVETDAERVLVAKTPIEAPAGSIPGLTTAETIGHYAFWVGDEGVKATATLVNPLLEPSTRINYDNAPSLPSGPVGDDWTGASNNQRDRLDQLMLPRPRIERIFTTLDPDATPARTELSKVVHAAQLNFVNNGPTVAQRRQAFHAITPLSLGVIADVPNGRLKRDLSDPAGASAVGDAILAYRNFRVTNPATGSGFVATYMPNSVEPAGAEATNANIAAFTAGPVLREVGFRFWFETDANGQVFLNYLVDAALWNPYSAELRLQPVASTATKLRIFLENIPDVQVSAGGAGQTVSLSTIVPNMVLAVDPTLTWNAGEIKTVAGTDGVDLAPGGGSVALDAGVNLGAGAAVTSVTYPSVSNLRVVLRWDDGGATPGILQIYEPDTNFSGDTDGSGPWSTYSHGWGFALANSMRTWTDGTATAPRDPRSTTLSGSFVDTGAWDTDIRNNASSAASGDLDGNATVVLFDLPRQELVSIGDLRNLTRINNTATDPEHPAMLGNGWGGTLNSYFDRYFFSTVPRNHTWDFQNEPLPNRYLRYYRPQHAAAPALADFLDPDDAARYFMAQGAFNINSTSEDAWRMVLGGRLAGWLSESAAGAQILDNVFFRLSHGAQQTLNAPASGTSITDAVAVSTGGRQLTSAQVTALAQQIVIILRDRGRPFDSIEEFLNHPGAGGTRGVIASAIEAAGINDPALNVDYRHAPAALTQADVVANIAPFISPRSDTFLIRVYGDTRNPVTTDIEARAWGEAVVQRVPETVDTGDNQITPTQPFGRRFKVTSFRWLTSDDI